MRQLSASPEYLSFFVCVMGGWEPQFFCLYNGEEENKAKQSHTQVHKMVWKTEWGPEIRYEHLKFS